MRPKQHLVVASYSGRVVGGHGTLLTQRITRMDYRQKIFRTALLLGVAFFAGVAIGPAYNLIVNSCSRSRH